MIPTTGADVAAPIADGHIAFHVVVDHTTQTFSIDGPDGANGIKLHFDVLQAARLLQRKFWKMDIRAKSWELALAEIQRSFPGYKCVGTWADANVNRTILGHTAR
jgi:hypothetical protein